MAKPNEIKYLTAIKAEKRPKKYCRFKKMGIHYIDYKDGNKEKQIKASNLNGEIEINVPSLSNKASFNIKLNALPKQVQLNNKKIKTNWDEAKKILKVPLSVNKDNTVKIIL